MNDDDLRRNPVNGKMALVAPGRASRPAEHERRAGDEAAPVCPFCAGREQLTPPELDAARPPGSTANGPGWRVRVVPNKYPALSEGHEVILHSPDHNAELEDLGDEALTEVLMVWGRRIAAQHARGAAAAILIVNRGAGSGASLEHPHEQLLGTPVVPPLLLDELLEFDRYRARYGGCVLCSEVEAAGDRLVLEEPFAAWVPAASRFNGELWLAPRDHQAALETADLPRLAVALRQVLVAITTATDHAPLNFWLHTAPADLLGPFHWHLEFAPRTAAIAGFELGSDIGVVTRDPAAAAAAYRAALPRD